MPEVTHLDGLSESMITCRFQVCTLYSYVKKVIHLSFISNSNLILFSEENNKAAPTSQINRKLFSAKIKQTYLQIIYCKLSAFIQKVEKTSVRKHLLCTRYLLWDFSWHSKWFLSELAQLMQQVSRQMLQYHTAWVKRALKGVSRDDSFGGFQSSLLSPERSRLEPGCLV